MSYRVDVDKRAARQLLALPKTAAARLLEVLQALLVDPRPPGAKKLTGRGGYRIRVGVYRVLYEIEDKHRVVRVYQLGHRREVYR